VTDGHYNEPVYEKGDTCGWCNQPLSGAVRIGNPNAARERIVHKECFDESVRIAHGPRMTAEEAYDARQEQGVDDWKGREDR
jgi:hypothetical protein